MTVRRTITSTLTRLPGRRAAVAVAVGAGVVLTPLPAFAAAGPVPSVGAQIHAATPAAQAVVNTAMSALGKPYAWGGAGPSSFDCSGLALYAYRAAGFSLPHSAAAQSTMGTPVSRSALQPGDLVFFYGTGHVGIYIGNDEVIHAPTAGDVVKVTPIAYMPFSSARRLT